MKRLAVMLYTACLLASPGAAFAQAKMKDDKGTMMQDDKTAKKKMMMMKDDKMKKDEKTMKDDKMKK